MVLYSNFAAIIVGFGSWFVVALKSKERYQELRLSQLKSTVDNCSSCHVPYFNISLTLVLDLHVHARAKSHLGTGVTNLAKCKIKMFNFLNEPLCIIIKSLRMLLL